jgi:hypothetical protein
MDEENMNFFSNLFKKNAPQPEQQAVIIHFQYGLNDLAPLFALEEQLETSINSAQVGEFDGNEIAVDMHDAYLFMYGPDAEKIFQVILPVIQSAPFMNGASVKLRYGPPQDGVQEKVVNISF